MYNAVKVAAGATFERDFKVIKELVTSSELIVLIWAAVKAPTKLPSWLITVEFIFEIPELVKKVVSAGPKPNWSFKKNSKIIKV